MRTKLALIIEYDGSRYHGFQLQPLSPTVQEVLEQAVFDFTGERLRVDCASRTDAGVHAEAQVVSLRTASPLEPEVWVRALNHFLPDDVAVLSAHRIPDGYNVRTAATGRVYRYRILNRRAPSPLMRLRALWVHQALDLEAMNKAAAGLIGERDFAPFCGQDLKEGAKTIRTLSRAEFRRDGEYVIFDVEGSGFLPQQVRRMAGALLRVGQGKQTLTDFWRVANTGRRGEAKPTLPPHGLTLVRVLYQGFPPESEASSTGTGRT